MIKSGVSTLAVAVLLSLSCAACKDTKTLQQNQQLTSQVAELQKENGELGNNIELLTAERDSLKKENDALKTRAQGQAAAARKPKRRDAKATASRKRRRRAKPQTTA